MRKSLDAILDGAAAIGDGLLDIASFGDRSARRARRIAGLDDPRPGHVKDAEAIRGDWEAVVGRRPFLEPIADRITCWSCGKPSAAPQANILANMACLTCPHCGATNWIWPAKTTG